MAAPPHKREGESKQHQKRRVEKSAPHKRRKQRKTCSTTESGIAKKGRRGKVAPPKGGRVQNSTLLKLNLTSLHSKLVVFDLIYFTLSVSFNCNVENGCTTTPRKRRKTTPPKRRMIKEHHPQGRWKKQAAPKRKRVERAAPPTKANMFICFNHNSFKSHFQHFKILSGSQNVQNFVSFFLWVSFRTISK